MFRSILLGFLLAGCAAQERSVSVPVATLPAPTASIPTGEAPIASTPPPKLPDGYVEMTLAGVINEGSGASVALLDPKTSLVVEVHVGGSEALSIQHRFEHTHYQRPLTHDLMDAMMKQSGMEVARAQVDKLENGTFIGTLVVKSKNRWLELDARPSDAIALAMGANAPIYCASEVIKRAGVPKDQVDGL
jgi:bifunctional DNase/RNase